MLYENLNTNTIVASQQIHRKVLNLAKQFLYILEDIKNDKNWDFGAKRKRTLDLANDTIREIGEFLSYYQFDENILLRLREKAREKGGTLNYSDILKLHGLEVVNYMDMQTKQESIGFRKTEKGERA